MTEEMELEHPNTIFGPDTEEAREHRLEGWVTRRFNRTAPIRFRQKSEGLTGSPGSASAGTA